MINWRFLFAVAACALTLSCSSSKKTTQADITIGSEPAKPAPAAVPPKTDTVIKPVEVIPNDQLKGFDYRSKTFEISLMLPFLVDSIHADADLRSTDSENYGKRIKRLKPESKEAVEFYQGVLLALDSLKVKGVNINLYVHDTEGSSYTTRQLLTESSSRDADVIIGPFGTEPAKLVAEFCRQNKIWNISPKSPSRSVTLQNPYHIKFNPTLSAHCKRMVKYLNDSTVVDELIILTRQSDRERGIAALFEKAHEELKRSKRAIAIEIVEVEEDEWGHFKFKPGEYLNFGKVQNQAVAIASFNESFVQNMLTKLHGYTLEQTDNKFDKGALILGMPTLANSQSLRLDYFCDLNMNLTTNYFIAETQKEEYDRFLTAFDQKFEHLPSQNAVAGYDLMRYTGSLLMRDIRLFPFDEPTYSGLSTQFEIVDVHGDKLNKKSVSFRQNGYLHLLKYADYRLIKVY